MLRFPDKATVPPQGWRYLQRETGTTICGGDWGNLLQNIIAHRQANNIPIGAAFEDAVEFDICEMLKAEGTNWCVDSNTGLGDSVYALAHRMAIQIDNVAGTNLKECGACQKRRELLNNITLFK